MSRHRQNRKPRRNKIIHRDPNALAARLEHKAGPIENKKSKKRKKREKITLENWEKL